MIINPDRTERLDSPSRAITDTSEEFPSYYTFPATPEEVEKVINADPRLSDGVTRSEWRWFRMADGDLILGVYPQDDLYFQLIDQFDQNI